jgi:hypothetical protein
MVHGSWSDFRDGVPEVAGLCKSGHADAEGIEVPVLRDLLIVESARLPITETRAGEAGLGKRIVFKNLNGDLATKGGSGITGAYKIS